MGSAQLDVRSMPGPETIARRTFANGATGLALENYSSPSVVVHGWLRVGSVDEEEQQAGLAGFTASMLTQGTECRTFAQIGEQIESLGAALSMSSAGHTTTFTAKCLAEDLGQVLDILTDCLYHPAFPETYVEKTRGEILTAIREAEHNTQSMAALRFYELMYPAHPYGRSQLGYTSTIEKLTRGDIQAFYQQRYGADGMGVILVGAVPRERALDVLEEAMGEWGGASNQRSSLPPVPHIDQTCTQHTTIPGKTQSDIVMGWVGLRRQDPDFMAAYVANCVLGQFGMMGRIGDSVRDKQGLAYYAYTSLHAGFGPGPWAAIAGVDPRKVESAVQGILEQVRRVRQEPIGEGELADNKSYIVGSLPLRLESKEGLAAQIAHMELHELGLDYLRRLPGLVDAVTPDQIIQVTCKYTNPDAYVLSVAGPQD